MTTKKRIYTPCPKCVNRQAYYRQTLGNFRCSDCGTVFNREEPTKEPIEEKSKSVWWNPLTWL